MNWVIKGMEISSDRRKSLFRPVQVGFFLTNCETKMNEALALTLSQISRRQACQLSNKIQTSRRIPCRSLLHHGSVYFNETQQRKIGQSGSFIG